MIKRYIEIPFQREGYHLYPGADKDPNLATGEWDDVSHLGLRHFHYFFFKVKIEVFQNNRDIEFIQFSRYCQRKFDNGPLELNGKSCEMIAEDLIKEISQDFPNREIYVSVFEDNINGSTIEYYPD